MLAIKWPVYLEKLSSIVIYIFRGHVRAYLKGNDMLFEIIYTLRFVGVVSLLYR